MSDLISRQAAIKIASGFCHPANIAKELAKLPSAQAEPSKTARDIATIIENEKDMRVISKNEPLKTDQKAPFDEFISRKAAIDAVDNVDCSDGVGISAIACEVVEDIQRAIKDLPSVHPDLDEVYAHAETEAEARYHAEQKKGKWIKYEQEFRLEGQLETVQKTVRECSICRTKIAGMVGIMNFCPNCGARMEGE